jgi:hypothetical protein
MADRRARGGVPRGVRVPRRVRGVAAHSPTRRSDPDRSGGPEAVTFRPDPKPARSNGGMGRRKRRQALAVTADVKARIRAAKCQVCRLCGRGSSPELPINAAHLVPRGMGGTIGGEWVEPNIIGLCGHGNVDGCHGLIDSYDPEACVRLRLLLTDDEVGYVVAKKGQGWFDRRFPLRAAA